MVNEIHLPLLVKELETKQTKSHLAVIILVLL